MRVFQMVGRGTGRRRDAGEQRTELVEQNPLAGCVTKRYIGPIPMPIK
jgi:hypothetical protein